MYRKNGYFRECLSVVTQSPPQIFNEIQMRYFLTSEFSDKFRRNKTLHEPNLVTKNV